MADTEETPAQRQARIRREKREAKINANAQDRLDKITRLSGRTPEATRNESPAPTPGTATPPSPPSPPIVSPQARPSNPPPNAGTPTPEQARMQEDYLRALLRGPPPGVEGQNQTADGPNQEDPMMQMLQQMMSGIGGEGDPNNPGGLPFNPDDLAQHTGLPSWVMNMFLGGQKAPPSPAEERSQRMWRIIHIVVALVSGLYMLFTINKSTLTFGAQPPAPATFQNPFVVFMMAELLLQSTRIITAGPTGKRGPGLWYQMLKELAGDGAVMVFMLGVASWWNGSI